MNEFTVIFTFFKVIGEVAKTYGATTILIGYLIFDKWWVPRKKKLEFQDTAEDDAPKKLKTLEALMARLLAEYNNLSHSMNELQQNGSQGLSELKGEFHSHLEREKDEDIRNKAMEKDIEFQGKEIAETKGDVKDIFKVLSEIKNMVIEIHKAR